MALLISHSQFKYQSRLPTCWKCQQNIAVEQCLLVSSSTKVAHFVPSRKPFAACHRKSTSSARQRKAKEMHKEKREEHQRKKNRTGITCNFLRRDCGAARGKSEKEYAQHRRKRIELELK